MLPINMSIELNERQRQAVEHVHGPMLVIAGAGTGKTTVLVSRIARLIADGHARADEILAITYTENAATEMQQRVGHGDLRACTFHAYCFGIMQRCGKAFRVVDEKDLWVYLRRRIAELPLEHFRPARNPAEFLDALLAFFQRCHDELITPAQYEGYVERLRQGRAPLPRVTRTKQAGELSRDDVLACCAEIAAVFRAVEEMLRAENLGTFGHMISGAIALLRADAELLYRERQRARFILIDEFQDANVGQIELAALLAGEQANLFAVGDPDQAIYRFRGASSAAFEEFRRRFSATSVVRLNDNQRSTSKILDASFFVISENPDFASAGQDFRRARLQSAREARALNTGEPLENLPVQVVLPAGPEEEAAEVATAIENLRGAADDDELDTREKIERWCAVLYRSHAHRDELARELAWRKVPFVVQGLDAFETGDVRDAIACLEALESERDGVALFRIASLPMFGLQAERVRDELRAAGRNPDLAGILEKVPGGAHVLQVLSEARTQGHSVQMDARAALEIAITYFHLPASPPIRALREFISAWHAKPITRTGQLQEFLEYLEFFREAGGSVLLPEASMVAGGVKLMTAHAAKGLEFKHIFVLRANSGSFPSSYREALFEFPPELREISQPELDEHAIHKEEERRLFYVAMTRARDCLTLHAKPGRRKSDDTPPGFVGELMRNRAACGSWRRRALEASITIHAGIAQPHSALGEWLLGPGLPAAEGLVLSATAIQKYKDCPLQFKIYREWNIPGEVAAGMLFGNAMHTALKGFYDTMKAGRPQTEGALLECFRQALADLHFNDDLQRRLYEGQGVRQLSAFFAAQAPEPAPEVIATESTFEIVIRGVCVRGRIDRLDRVAGDHVVLTDYKTGSPRKQKDADESVQLSLYALACRQRKLIPDRLVFYNLEDNEAVSSARTDAQLEAIEHEVCDVAQGIAAGEFDANPGFHCRSCAYRQLCPATEQWII